MRAAIWLMTFLLVLAPLPGGAEEGPPGFELFAHELSGVALVPVEAPIPVLSSASAVAKARPYAAVIAEALDFFRRELGWEMKLSLVILDRADWAKVTEVPFPAPHVVTLSKVVVMPDSLAAYPGFERWGLPDELLNQGLTVHEIGHALVQTHALKWPKMTHTVDELLANVMMAGFIAAERPEFSFLLLGAPAGFSAPGSQALSDLDYFYGGLGLETYAWHPFELARGAGVMARAKPIGTLMPELIAALGIPKDDLPETVIAELERVVPGVKQAFGAFAPESMLPLASSGICAATLGVAGPGTRNLLAVENRSARVLRARNVVDEEAFLKSLREEGKSPENSPDLFQLEPALINPGEVWRTAAAAGQDIILDDSCVRMADGPLRFVVRE